MKGKADEHEVTYICRDTCLDKSWWTRAGELVLLSVCVIGYYLELVCIWRMRNPGAMEKNAIKTK